MDEETKIVPVTPTLSIAPKEALELSRTAFNNVTFLLSQAIQQELTPTEQADYHEWTSKAADSLKNFKEALRSRLLEVLTSQGTRVTEKGTLQIELGEGRVQRAVPSNTKPDDKLVESRVRAKDLSPEVWMDRVITYKVNESKLQSLVDSGQFTKEDYAACFKPTSYRVGKPQKIGESDDE